VISNRFAALVDVDLGDATGNIEENLNRMVRSSTKEDDIENDDDESSTAETDFVDATQVQDEDNISQDSGSNHEIIPERIQQDIQFLKDSWANIVENEDAEKRLMDDLERDEPSTDEQSASFQMVQSKKTAKLKKKTAAKIPYSTRSKVGHSKPSK
jgi:hypothetical protein